MSADTNTQPFVGSPAEPGAARERAVVEAVPRELYVGGQWRAASGGGTLTVEDPSTGEALTEVADAHADDALAALAAAADMQAQWAATAPRERGEILRRPTRRSWRARRSWRW